MLEHDNTIFDKLRGHSYNLNYWQYMDAQCHMDPELQWIVCSVVEEFRDAVKKRDPANQTYRVRELFQNVAKATYDTMCEREGYTPDAFHHSMYVSKISDKMVLAYMKMYPDSQSNKSMIELAEDFLIYAVSGSLTNIRYHRG